MSGVASAGAATLRARSLAAGMQSFYQMPFEPFERYSPYGTAEEVADFLYPYVEAGCSVFNVIPCAGTTRPLSARSLRYGELLATGQTPPEYLFI